MPTREEFYRQRDSRSELANPLGEAPERPVTVHIGTDAAGCPRGQSLALALVNMAARFHRRIHIDAPAAPLRIDPLAGATTLAGALAATALAVDPFIELLPGAEEGGVSIGIGLSVRPGLTAYVGCRNYVGVLAREPVTVDAAEGFSFGAGAAACLGSAALFKAALGGEVAPAAFSLWSLRGGDEAFDGPDIVEPIELGSVLQVGAGGVGACLAYWLRQIGVRGDWTTVDRDIATIDNLNRCLPFTAVHAGVGGSNAEFKARIVAGLIGGRAVCSWYDELDQDSIETDLILPLADARGIRRDISLRGAPVLLHATTEGRTWMAQFHRHLLGIDDCVACRVPARSASSAALACGKGQVQLHSRGAVDASLPFLSAAAGLVLAAGIDHFRRGRLGLLRHNRWDWAFGAPHAAPPGIHRCAGTCGTRLPEVVVRRLSSSLQGAHL